MKLSVSSDGAVRSAQSNRPPGKQDYTSILHESLEI